MKLGLKKKSFKSLSATNKQMPKDATPAVAGGRVTDYWSNHCWTHEINTCDSAKHTNVAATYCGRSAMC
ncbi:hypothetical protein [Pseudoalteromonas ardens]|nr:hypothetical protein [Pseudoalteromonas sp. R96]MDK1310658.1 hypothetical protein [Pseudoalteromonas sp. R96]